MKNILAFISLYFVISIDLIPITLGLAAENNELEVVTHLNLNRFQGIWYEIGHNPWFPEKSCFAMIVHYKLTGDGKINVTNVFRKNGFDGEIRKVTGTAWVVEPANQAKWEV